MDFLDWILRVLRDVIVPIIVVIGMPLFLWYKRDRRKSRAETFVAEGTVGSKIATEEVGAMGASVAFVNEAFRMERESKDRLVKELRAELRDTNIELEETRQELARVKQSCIQELADHKSESIRVKEESDRQIAELRVEIDLLRAQLESR